MIGQAKMYDKIMEVADKLDLSEWEVCFLGSIAERAKAEQLSPKQLAILRKIYEKACASPY